MPHLSLSLPQAYRRGMSINRLAAMHGMTRPAVKKALLAAGVELRTHSEANRAAGLKAKTCMICGAKKGKRQFMRSKRYDVCKECRWREYGTERCCRRCKVWQPTHHFRPVNGGRLLTCRPCEAKKLKDRQIRDAEIQEAEQEMMRVMIRERAWAIYRDREASTRDRIRAAVVLKQYGRPDLDTMSVIGSAAALCAADGGKARGASW